MTNFKIGKVELEYLYHNHNCGIGKHRTERTCELPIANYWLNKVNSDVVEIGAVTPYYHNYIKTIIDPADKKATIKSSLFDCDFTDRDVLSISTIEHVGLRQYGLNEDTNAILALDFITNNSNRYLITFPYGGNKLLDEILLSGELNNKCKNIYIISRQPDEEWIQTDIKGLLNYGRFCGNSVVILERGDIFEEEPKRS